MRNKQRLGLVVAGIVAFVFAFLTSLASARGEERFDYKVRNDFFAGFAGDQEALDRAMKACEAALKADPKNAEALVWHGGGLYYLGGLAYGQGDAEKGQPMVIKGIGEMDRAVELAPSNPGVRIPRGAILLQSTLYMEGNPMERMLIEKGLADYEKALEVQASRWQQLGTHPRGELLFGIADAQRRLGNQAEAAKFFDRISTELKGSDYQRRANIWRSTKTLNADQVRCYGCHTTGK